MIDRRKPEKFQIFVNKPHIFIATEVSLKLSFISTVRISILLTDKPLAVIIKLTAGPTSSWNSDRIA